ncbi:hypothetical protein Tco_0157727 [Tanacetum coccineum]
MDPHTSLGRLCMDENYKNSLNDKIKSEGNKDGPEYQDTADSGKKKEVKAFTFLRTKIKEVCKRYITSFFVEGLDAYDGETDLEYKKNLISNEFAGKLYFVSFIINPKEDDVELGVIFRLSFLRLANGIVDFRNEILTICPDLITFNDDSDDELDALLMSYDGEGPSLIVNRPRTQEELSREEREEDRYERIMLLNERRSIIETLKYIDKHKRILDSGLLDKLKLDGEFELEEEMVGEELIKGYRAIKEKSDPRVFVLPIRLEGKYSYGALLDTDQT